jgi:hypothetical protein
VTASPTHIKGESSKLQPSLEGPYTIVTWIEDVVYRLQQHLRRKLMVVYLDWLAPCQGTTRDEQLFGGSSWGTSSIDPTNEEWTPYAVETGSRSVEASMRWRCHLWRRSQTSQACPLGEEMVIHLYKQS